MTVGVECARRSKLCACWVETQDIGTSRGVTGRSLKIGKEFESKEVEKRKQAERYVLVGLIYLWGLWASTLSPKSLGCTMNQNMQVCVIVSSHTA